MKKADKPNIVININVYGDNNKVSIFHFVFSFVLIVVVDAKFVRIDLNAGEDE